MDRQQHLEWCKQRAHEYLDHGDVQNAIASMLSDLRKHHETERSASGAIAQLALFTAMSGNVHEAKRFIDGFN